MPRMRDTANTASITFMGERFKRPTRQLKRTWREPVREPVREWRAKCGYDRTVYQRETRPGFLRTGTYVDTDEGLFGREIHINFDTLQITVVTRRSNPGARRTDEVFYEWHPRYGWLELIPF